MKWIILLTTVLSAQFARANGPGTGDCQTLMGAPGQSARLETSEGCRGNFMYMKLELTLSDGSNRVAECDAENFLATSCHDAATGIAFPTQVTDDDVANGIDNRTVKILYRPIVKSNDGTVVNGAPTLFQCQVPAY